MTKWLLRLAGAVAIAGLISSGAAYLMPAAQSTGVTAQPGATAPVFTAKDISGNAVNLSDYRGKTVILEWTNNGSVCRQALQQRQHAGIATAVHRRRGHLVDDCLFGPWQ